MNTLPLELENLIIEYKSDMEHMEHKLKLDNCLKQIKQRITDFHDPPSKFNKFNNIEYVYYNQKREETKRVRYYNCKYVGFNDKLRCYSFTFSEDREY